MAAMLIACTLLLVGPLQTLEVYSAMEDLKEGGQVLSLGVSNIYDPVLLATLYAHAKIKPAVVQNRCVRQ